LMGAHPLPEGKSGHVSFQLLPTPSRDPCRSRGALAAPKGRVLNIRRLRGRGYVCVPHYTKLCSHPTSKHPETETERLVLVKDQKATPSGRTPSRNGRAAIHHSRSYPWRKQRRKRATKSVSWHENPALTETACSPHKSPGFQPPYTQSSLGAPRSWPDFHFRTWT
jgi:hypothetical protein